MQLENILKAHIEAESRSFVQFTYCIHFLFLHMQDVLQAALTIFLQEALALLGVQKDRSKNEKGIVRHRSTAQLGQICALQL